MNYMYQHGSGIKDNGYTIIPVAPQEKFPATCSVSTTADGKVYDWKPMHKWSEIEDFDPEMTSDWPECSIGIITGDVVAIDIDIKPATSSQDDLNDATHAVGIVRALAVKRLGDTPLIRQGEAPKIIMLYRTDKPFGKIKSGRIEALASGQQFVAFGVHPDTKKPYQWINDGQSPQDTDISRLPLITEAQVVEFLTEAATKHSLQPYTDKTPSHIDELSNSIGDRDPARLVGSPTAVASAVAAIPNARQDWDSFNRMAMLIYSASNGADWGLSVFSTWANKLSTDGKDAPESRWQALKGSPPTRNGGASSLYTMAHKDHGWRGVWEFPNKPDLFTSQSSFMEKHKIQAPSKAPAPTPTTMEPPPIIDDAIYYEAEPPLDDENYVPELTLGEHVTYMSERARGSLNAMTSALPYVPLVETDAPSAIDTVLTLARNIRLALGTGQRPANLFYSWFDRVHAEHFETIPSSRDIWIKISSEEPRRIGGAYQIYSAASAAGWDGKWEFPDAFDFSLISDALASKLEAKDTKLPSGVKLVSGPVEYVYEQQLVDGMFPALGTHVIGGQSGAGKTFVALDLALSLMTGEDFAGHKIERTGSIIYVAYEGAATLNKRLIALRQKLADPSRKLDLYVVSAPAYLNTDTGAESLAETIVTTAKHAVGRGKPVVGVMVDTIAASMAIEDENDPRGWSRLYAISKDLGSAINSSIFWVHHMGKDIEKGLRGSSNAVAGADSILGVLCTRVQSTGEVKNRSLALIKTRDGETGAVDGFNLSSVVVGKKPDGTPVDSVYVLYDKQLKEAQVDRGQLVISAITKMTELGDRYVILDHPDATGTELILVSDIVNFICEEEKISKDAKAKDVVRKRVAKSVQTGVELQLLKTVGKLRDRHVYIASRDEINHDVFAGDVS